MKSAMLRIIRDLKDIISDGPNENIAYAEPQDGYPLVVKACIIGPKSTPYEGNIFEVKIQFPDNYPISPPIVTFIGQMDHPDALAIEKSMMLFLQNSWTPQYTIKDILNCILGHLYCLDVISNELQQTASVYESDN